MEMKAVFTISIIGLLLLTSTMVIPGASAVGPPYGWVAHPPHHVKGAATSGPTGLAPSQIYSAYGINSLSCTLTTTSDWTDPQLCGHGQTIAIVDAYDDPTIANDLATFSTQFGLPACTAANNCFIKATPFGLPNSNSGWALEMALDVEWVHAVAPGAKIVLVEASSNSFNDLFNAINYATSQTGASQVSMSWGGSEFSGESTYDTYFNKPGVSFFASSGDSGTGTIYPSASPYVVAVGGTTLSFTNGISETAWSGSGGGLSAYESESSYQTNYQIASNGQRGIPDVSYDADPNSGVSVYDSTSYFGQTGWFVIGGTSAGAPQWAAISAIINSGGGQLSSALFGTNTALYNAATGTAYSANYRDITSGSNGNCGAMCNAGPSYDFVTGLGSPLTNGLIPYLEPPATPDFSISSSTSSVTVQQGGSGSSTITVTSLSGFNSVVSLTVSTPSGITATVLLTSVTPPSGGSATSTLSISVPSTTATGTYTIIVNGTSGSLSHSTAVSLTVTAPPPPPDFSISSIPSSLTINAGSSGNSTMILTSLNGFVGTVTLSTSTSDPSVTATLGSNSITLSSGGTGSTGLTISASNTGTYTVTVTGTSGSLSHSTIVTVTVKSPTPTLSVSVSTNHPSYTRNSFALITATVQSNSTPVSGASVTLTITLPNNGGVYSQGTGTTGLNGQVVFQVKIMPHSTVGTYTATAKASASGYNLGSGSTTFQVT